MAMTSAPEAARAAAPDQIRLGRVRSRRIPWIIRESPFRALRRELKRPGGTRAPLLHEQTNGTPNGEARQPSAASLYALFYHRGGWR
jgi:hypothetical protein